MVGIVIQARMGSTRMPGKIMKELAGKPMLWHIVERCRMSTRADRVIVATTENAEDNCVAEFCHKNNIFVSRGSAENVLERYYKSAKENKIKTVVRITGDCPLIDPFLIDKCVAEYVVPGVCDYVSNVEPGPRTFPRGLDVEVFSYSALERAYRNANVPYEREHVTPYIWENKKNEFIIKPRIIASPQYARSYRLTVDYPEDFELLDKIYKEFYREGAIISVPEVLKYLDLHPKVVFINAHCEQKPL